MTRELFEKLKTSPPTLFLPEIPTPASQKPFQNSRHHFIIIIIIVIITVVIVVIVIIIVVLMPPIILKETVAESNETQVREVVSAADKL